MAWQFTMAMRGYSRREVDELLARVVAKQVTADDVRQARFSKQTRGYAPRDVDAALAEILRDLEENPSPIVSGERPMAWQFTLAMGGYSRREVDELLARVKAKDVTASDVRQARFSKQGRGYAPREVDAAIAQILRELD